MKLKIKENLNFFKKNYLIKCQIQNYQKKKLTLLEKL